MGVECPCPPVRNDIVTLVSHVTVKFTETRLRINKVSRLSIMNFHREKETMREKKKRRFLFDFGLCMHTYFPGLQQFQRL